MPASPGRRLVILGTLVIAGGIGIVLLGSLEPDNEVARRRIEAAESLRPPTDTDRAVTDGESAVDNAPEDPDALAQLAHGYLQLARETGDPANYELAEASIERVLALDPTHVEGLVAKGALELARHEFRAALATGERALALDPRRPRTLGLIGDALVELGEYERSIEVIQTMVDGRPDLASYSRVSYLRELHGDLEGAIDAMATAIQAGAPGTESTEYLRVQLGHLHVTAGAPEDARVALETALENLPDYPPALAGLGRLHAASGDLDAAVDAYQRATDLLPVPGTLASLGEALEAAGQVEEAEDTYALVRAMHRLYEANGAQPSLELASFLTDHGEDAEATLAYARAVHAAQPNVFAADTLAWALYRAGEIEEAADRADEALRLGTQDARMLLHAGVIAAAVGDRDRARDLLESSLELAPAGTFLDTERARTALAELGGD